MQIEIKKFPKSEVEITGELSAEEFEKFYKKALKEFSQKASIPGFRSGNIPEKILIEKVGEANMLDRAAEMAIQSIYPDIVKEQNLDVIGPPKASITKIAKFSPLGFKITAAVLPNFVVPKNHKEIAKKIMERKDEIIIEEKEADQALEQLRKMRTGIDKQVPELNDDFAKSVGKFNTLNELRDALKKNIKFEKEMKAREKKRLEILDAILKETELEVPEVLVNGEKNTMLYELKASILSMGLKWEDYLNHIKKKEEEILDGWTEEANKRVGYGLLLDQLAKLMKVRVEEGEIDEKIHSFHSHSDQKLDEQKLKDYAYGIIRNEKIFNFLETC